MAATFTVGFKETSLGRELQRNPGQNEAMLRPEEIVVSRPQRQGSADERSGKNGRTALDSALGSQNQKCLLTEPTTLYTAYRRLEYQEPAARNAVFQAWSVLFVSLVYWQNGKTRDAPATR